MTPPVTHRNRSWSVTIDDLGSPPRTVDEAARRLPGGGYLLGALRHLLAFSQTRPQSELWVAAGLRRASGGEQREAVLQLAARYGVALHSDGSSAAPGVGSISKRGAPPHDAVTLQASCSKTALRRAAALPCKSKAGKGQVMSRQQARTDLDELVDRRVALGSLSRAIGTQQAWTLGVLGRLSPGEVRGRLEQKVGKQQSELLYRELAQVGARRLVSTVGDRIRSTLNAADRQLDCLIDSPRSRSAWIEGFDSQSQRTEALTRLGVEQDAAVEIASDPAGHDGDLVDVLEDSRDTVRSILFDVGAAHFSEDSALRLLEEHPLAASRVLRTLDIGKGSFLQEALGQLKGQGAQMRRYKARGRVALGIAASLITGGIFAGVGATAWAAGVTSGMVSASTSVLNDVPDLVGAVLMEEHARLAKGQGLADNRTLQGAQQQQQRAVGRMVFNAATSFAASTVASARNAYLKAVQSRYAVSEAAEVATGVAASEGAKAVLGAEPK